jgi:hypothetical protein
VLIFSVGTDRTDFAVFKAIEYDLNAAEADDRACLI